MYNYIVLFTFRNLTILINLSFRQPSFKLQQTAKKKKDAWTVQFECMHGVVGPRSLVEGQHVWSYRA